MLFLVWLVDQGLLTPIQVVEVARAAGRRNPPIGRVARDEGFMTLKAVMHTLQEQAQEPTARFGDVAIRLGYLDEAQVKLVVGAQAWRQPRLNDLIVELGYLDPETVGLAQVRFTSRFDNAL